MMTTTPTHEPVAQLLADLAERITLAIVLKPDRVQVDLAVSEVQIYISLVVDPDDMGLMIGRKGRVAKALRIILQAAAMRHGRRVQVEISPH
jgi:predicted RNA-binding protein YlqC (UPF0109 family)